MKRFSRLRDFAFRCRYAFRGVPLHFGDRIFRLDESLRRWKPQLEQPQFALMRQELRPGDVAIDVGANFGLLTLYAASLVSRTGHVYSFEPVPRSLRLLRRNVRLNHLEANVTIVPRAVSNSPAPWLDFYVPEAAVAVTASLLGANCGTRIRVPNIRLDDVQFSDGELPKLIKIDVEGAELEVLRGGRDLLTRSRPVLLIEVHGFALSGFGAKPSDVDDFLERLGYRKSIVPMEGSRADYYQALFVSKA